MFGILENVREPLFSTISSFSLPNNSYTHTHTHTHTHTQRTPQDKTEPVADKCKLHKGQQLPWQ